MPQGRHIEVSRLLLVVLAIGLSIRTFFLQPQRISTDSMHPTLTAGDHVLVDRVSYNFRGPRRGEVVTLRTARLAGIEDGQTAFFVKRIVGLPGESISIADDRHVVVDGKRLTAVNAGFEDVYSFTGPARVGDYSGHVNQQTAERYGRDGINVAPRFPSAQSLERLNADQLFVLGDNTMVSQDSRTWGPIPVVAVSGRVWIVYWPWSVRSGWIR